MAADGEVTWIGLTWREIASFATGVVAGIVVDRNSDEIKAGIAAVGTGLGVRDALNRWANGETPGPSQVTQAREKVGAEDGYRKMMVAVFGSLDRAAAEEKRWLDTGKERSGLTLDEVIEKGARGEGSVNANLVALVEAFKRGARLASPKE